MMASSKKKITQDELRRLMNEQKKKFLTTVKKIESPLARYDKDGTLHCVVCESVVRSEAVWSVHINSKNHKQNISKKVKKKEDPPEVILPSKLKRQGPPSPPQPSAPPKKLKSILKNSSAHKNLEKTVKSSISPGNRLLGATYNDDDEEDDDEEEEENRQLANSVKDQTEDAKKATTVQEALPEGFFDDPKLDAKVRNVEYKDPIEEEWEKFQKEIKEETNKAQEIIAEDQEEATTERQIDEIDEQIRNWSRVVSLEKKKECVNTTVSKQKADKNEDENSEDEDFEEFLDWRSKKSFEHKLNKMIPI